MKLKLSKPPPTGKKNYHFLEHLWKQEQMGSFKDFSRWYNNKNDVPILEAMQKSIAFCHNEDTDILKSGCTLPNLASVRLPKSTESKFHPTTESDKDLLDKI